MKASGQRGTPGLGTSERAGPSGVDPADVGLGAGMEAILP